MTMFDGIYQNTFKNVKSKCYIGKKIDSGFDEYGNEIKIFDDPKCYFFNIQPVTSTSDIQEFGENTSKMKVAVITNRQKYENTFNEFDCAYLDGATPEGETLNGEKANYRVYSVQKQNTVIRVFFIKVP